MNLILLAVLIACLAVITSLLHTTFVYRRRYNRAVQTNLNLNRALSISKDAVIRLKIELKWRDKQIELLHRASPSPTLDMLKARPEEALGLDPRD